MSDNIIRLSVRCRVSLILAFVFLMSLTLGQSAFALNAGSGNKVVTYSGYRYVNDTQIQVWVDKNIGTGPFEHLQFRIFEGTDTSGTKITISSVEAGSGSNISSVSGLSRGGSYLISSAVPFKSGKVYTVVLNNTINTNNGINLGQFYFHKDTEFSFTAPDTPGTPNVNGIYTSVAPKLDSRPEKNAINVPQEVMIWFSLNIPMDNTTAAQFSNYTAGTSTLVLKKNGVPVTYDYSINDASDGDIYAPIVTDDRTTVKFPMVGGGSAYSYNLDSNATYTLEIPAITLVNGTVIPKQTLKFTTASDIVPTKFEGELSAAPSGPDLTITWPACNENKDLSGNLLSPAASSYNVWYSDNPYWDFVKLNPAPVPASTTSYTTSGLKPSTTYYFRVTAVNGSAETGFSDYVQATTPGPNTDPNTDPNSDPNQDTIAPSWPNQSALTVTNLTENGLTLTWPAATDNVGVAAYKIYQNGAAIGTVNGGGTTTYNVIGLSASIPYTFQVQAGDAAGNWSFDGPSTSIEGNNQPKMNLNDIAGHWAQSNIEKLVGLDAISGYPDGSFKPGKTITRAEFATILVKAFKLTAGSGKIFTDTAEHWAKDAIATAASAGIVNGYDADTFGPNDLITREQMAAMIVNAAKLSPAVVELQFVDSDKVSQWAKQTVITAVSSGIMNGYPDNKFQPRGNATRAEAVTVIVNALK